MNLSIHQHTPNAQKSTEMAYHLFDSEMILKNCYLKCTCTMKYTKVDPSPSIFINIFNDYFLIFFKNKYSARKTGFIWKNVWIEIKSTLK